jgi:hypothetical protein
MRVPRMCTFWARGGCRFGEECRFLHQTPSSGYPGTPGSDFEYGYPEYAYSEHRSDSPLRITTPQTPPLEELVSKASPSGAVTPGGSSVSSLQADSVTGGDLSQAAQCLSIATDGPTSEPKDEAGVKEAGAREAGVKVGVPAAADQPAGAVSAAVTAVEGGAAVAVAGGTRGGAVPTATAPPATAAPPSATVTAAPTPTGGAMAGGAGAGGAGAGTGGVVGGAADFLDLLNTAYPQWVSAFTLFRSSLCYSVIVLYLTPIFIYISTLLFPSSCYCWPCRRTPLRLRLTRTRVAAPPCTGPSSSSCSTARGAASAPWGPSCSW